MRSTTVLIICLYSLVMLSACEDRNEQRSSPGAIRQFADSYKNKARSVDDELKRSADSRRNALKESDGEPSQ